MTDPAAVRTIAVADIGGTNARFALAEIAGGRVKSLGEPVTLATADHASFPDAWRAFAARNPGAEPDAIAIAFAGPLRGGQLRMTNSPWVIAPATLPAELGVRDQLIVNDFGAVGHAVARLDEDAFVHLCGPTDPPPATGVTTIVGPGTGLGAAMLVREEADYRVLETEAGHIGFAPSDAFEERLAADLRQRFGRASAERVASGGGFDNLYRAIAAEEGHDVPDAIDDKHAWTAALAGTDPIAVAALGRFFRALGSIAGDLALAQGADSVVIAGGLGYRLRDRFAGSGFAARFAAKGRFSGHMEAIPVRLLIHPQPGLYGAAAAFARSHP